MVIFGKFCTFFLFILTCCSLAVPRQAAALAPLQAMPVVILDAGHGGADGGAVALDGTAESTVNLSITRRLEQLLLFCGQRVALTRSGEEDLSSPEAKTIREKKVSDLKNRVHLINSFQNAILISIHQNSLPVHPEVEGAQVFYNTLPDSDALAVAIQQPLNNACNRSGAKTCRPIGSDIYLMKNVNCTAALVECGFLSNAREALALTTAEYQTQLALAITAGYLNYRSGGVT